MSLCAARARLFCQDLTTFIFHLLEGSLYYHFFLSKKWLNFLLEETAFFPDSSFLMGASCRPQAELSMRKGLKIGSGSLPPDLFLVLVVL